MLRAQIPLAEWVSHRRGVRASRSSLCPLTRPPENPSSGGTSASALPCRPGATLQAMTDARRAGLAAAAALLPSAVNAGVPFRPRDAREGRGPDRPEAGGATLVVDATPSPAGVNSHQPEDYLIATTLKLDPSPRALRRGKYPPGKMKKFAFAEKPLSPTGLLDRVPYRRRPGARADGSWSSRPARHSVPGAGSVPFRARVSEPPPPSRERGASRRPRRAAAGTSVPGASQNRAAAAAAASLRRSFFAGGC
jgi:hypothetical protein